MRFLQDDLMAKQEDKLIGRELGDYRLLERLGEGGMGIVFRASRIDQQFERDVAIKLVSGVPAAAQLNRRFARERQIQASLNHPFIAQLYDAGVTDEGWPYLVMELIQGDAIDQYCATKALSLESRVELMLKVCSAVAFAHANLVIHRDIKPSNILVDANGNPKLLDFGIAKLLEDESGELSVLARPMTPSYASTEQILGEPITIASDVFQLGALLCKVLSGEAAFDSRTPEDAIKRATSEMDVSLPTNILKTLPVELSAIITKCLHAQPSDRYSDVNALREDLNRYLSGYPVTARHPTPLQRFGKFIRRNQVTSTIAGIALFIILAGNYWYTNRLAESRDEAQIAADRATAVSEFLVELFSATDPTQSRGNTVTARELLDTGARQLETAFDDQSATLGVLKGTVGRTYKSLGLYEEAKPLLDEAVALAESSGDDPVQLAKTLLYRGDLDLEEGQFEPGETRLRQALAVLKSSPAPEVEAETLISLSYALHFLGQYSEAEQTAADGVVQYRQVYGEQSRETADAMGSLAYIMLSGDKVDESEELFNTALSIQRTLFAEPHPDLATTLNNLALLHAEYRGDYSAALPFFKEAVDVTRHVFGEIHLATGIALANLANTTMFLQDYEDTEATIKESLDIARAVVEENHPLTYTNLEKLGMLYMRQGKFEDAEPLVREALALKQSKLGNDHPIVGFSENNLAVLLNRTQQHAEARSLLEHGVNVLQAGIGSDDLRVLAVMANLAATALSTGDRNEAEKLATEIIETANEMPADGRYRVAGAWATLGKIRIEDQRYLEAETMLLNAYEMMRDQSTVERWKVRDVLLDIVRLYERLGDTAQANAFQELLDQE